MIRRALSADLAELAALGAEFHAEDRWSGVLRFDPESFALTCQALLERGAIFLSDHGLIGLSVSPSIYDHNLKVCSELFFWAPDGRGDALEAAARHWASRHADVILMGAHEPHDARVDRWYRRKGYAPIGRQYARRL